MSQDEWAGLIGMSAFFAVSVPAFYLLMLRAYQRSDRVAAALFGIGGLIAAVAAVIGAIQLCRQLFS